MRHSQATSFQFCKLRKKLAKLRKNDNFQHDLLILPILETLGIREEVLGKDMPPEFMSTIIIETMIVDNSPVVKVSVGLGFGKSVV